MYKTIFFNFESVKYNTHYQEVHYKEHYVSSLKNTKKHLHSSCPHNKALHFITKYFNSSCPIIEKHNEAHSFTISSAQWHVFNQQVVGLSNIKEIRSNNMSMIKGHKRILTISEKDKWN